MKIYKITEGPTITKYLIQNKDPTIFDDSVEVSKKLFEDYEDEFKEIQPLLKHLFFIAKQEENYAEYYKEINNILENWDE